jgi:hypothetical protein
MEMSAQYPYSIWAQEELTTAIAGWLEVMEAVFSNLIKSKNLRV